MLSIKNKLLSFEEIIKFIVEQDINFFSNDYSRNKYRDPEIFKYIIITDEDKEYLKNIELIKKHKLWNLFFDTSYKKSAFYSILISQMKKIRDISGIFDIFPIKSFDTEFTFKINGKINEFFSSGIKEREEDYEKLFI